MHYLVPLQILYICVMHETCNILKLLEARNIFNDIERAQNKRKIKLGIYIHTFERSMRITPISDFIYHLTDKFFGSCPAHQNPLIRSIGNDSLAELHRQYKKIHTQTAQAHSPIIAYSNAAVFFLCTWFFTAIFLRP